LLGENFTGQGSQPQHSKQCYLRQHRRSSNSVVREGL
jgi:hypothetical protein